jgi:predicted GNAT family acetyltransferase
MNLEVVHRPERSCYELLIDGRVVGLTDYVDLGDAVEIPHTEVDPSMQGQGLAGRMVAVVLDDLRERARLVVPTCPYVRTFIDRHSEYVELLRPEFPG